MQDRTEYSANIEVVELFAELSQALDRQKAKETAAYGAIDRRDDGYCLSPEPCTNANYHENWESIANRRFEALREAIAAMLPSKGRTTDDACPEIHYRPLTCNQEGCDVNDEARLLSKQTIFTFGRGGTLFDVDCHDLVDCLAPIYGPNETLFRIAVAVAACVSLVGEGKPCALGLRATIVGGFSDNWSISPATPLDNTSAIVLTWGDEEAIIAPICASSTGTVGVSTYTPIPAGGNLADIKESIQAVFEAISASKLVDSCDDTHFALRCDGSISETGLECKNMSLHLYCRVLSQWPATQNMIGQDLRMRIGQLSEDWQVDVEERVGFEDEVKGVTSEAERFGIAAAAVVDMPFKKGGLDRISSTFAYRNTTTVVFVIGGDMIANLFRRSGLIVAKLVKMAEVAAEAASEDEKAKISKMGVKRNQARRRR